MTARFGGVKLLECYASCLRGCNKHPRVPSMRAYWLPHGAGLTMRLFLSWSGELSHDIAECLYKWLPLVMQRVEPYMSSQSIEKGARWSSHLAKELEKSRFGIVVLTKDNLLEPWLHFEAGAIAKSLD